MPTPAQAGLQAQCEAGCRDAGCERSHRGVDALGMQACQCGTVMLEREYAGRDVRGEFFDDD